MCACVPIMLDPCTQAFPSANEAYQAYQTYQAYQAHQAYQAQLAHPVKVCDCPIVPVETSDTFRRMKQHFQMFGFLTDATYEGFVASVILPNTEMEKEKEIGDTDTDVITTQQP